jgi:hypothetical protein
MFWAAILFLILVAIFGRNTFKAIWWIIGLAPTAKLLEYANSSEAAASPTPAPTATPALLEYGFDEK